MPNIVSDWHLSKHSQNEVGCSVCHGENHKDPYDVEKVQIPTPTTCANCHEERVEQFMAGKHATAWAAMKAMPAAHWQPQACQTCHMGFDHAVLTALGDSLPYACRCHSRGRRSV